MKLIINFPPASYYFILLRPICSRQDSLLKHSQSMLIS
jgi:hypothetical protein